MNWFRYETHTHTSEVSKCSNISAKELVRFYKNLGYEGVCITDHFLNGNITVPKSLPWQERIKLFCRGFETAKNEGYKIGLDVFFGWEFDHHGTDFIIFGLDEKWLINHPDQLELSLNDYFDLVHQDGGFIIHAHPFREADYIDMLRLIPGKTDAVEIKNACRLDFENRLAEEYAENYELLVTAGSDNHEGELPKLCGIRTKRRLTSIQDMVNAIKSGETDIFEDNR